MTRAEELLIHIYKTQGPRDARGRVYPMKRYASLPLRKVNEKWDFTGRVLMHEIATAIANPTSRKNRSRQQR